MLSIQYSTILFISLSPYTWHHEIYTSILDKDIIETYKSDCFYNSRNYFYSQTPNPVFVGPVIINFHTDLKYLFDIKNIHSITA